MYPEVKAALERFSACDGTPSEAAVTAAWPTAWGERTIAIDGVPSTAPVRWPRDR